MMRTNLKLAFLLAPVCWLLLGMKSSEPLPKTRTRSLLELKLPDLSPYPFLNLSANKIQYPGSRHSLQGFYKAMDRLIFDGEGELTIMHMGGSHVQAGTLSNRIRESLHSFAPGMRGQRGFFFPFRLAKTNSPGNIKIEYTGNWEGCRNAVRSSDCRWGLSGVNATTTDEEAKIKLWSMSSDSVIYSFNSVNIYHPTHLPQMCIEFDESYPVTGMYTDSLGGFTRVEFSSTLDTLEFELHRRDSTELSFILQGIKYELEHNTGLSYHAIGVNGASVSSYLRSEDLERNLKSNAPDLVIFGIGINDAYMTTSEFDKEEFKSNYRQLMSRIRGVNPNVEFLFLTNNDSYYKKKRANRNGLTVQEAMFELCQDEGAALWDLFEIMGGLNSVRLWEDAGLAKRDKIHFTVEGYLLEADLLSESIYRGFSDYLEFTYPSITQKND